MKENKLIFAYNVGNQVLCFEPDPNKAKIIYHAKVLEQIGFRVQDKIKWPLYLVHFQGWKDKWNREVTENMLMDDTLFNRKLKKKIEEVANKVKNKESRRQRIDQILEVASASTGDDFDWSTCPGVWTEKDEAKRKLKAAKMMHDASAMSSKISGSSEESVSLDVDVGSVTSGKEVAASPTDSRTSGRPEDDEVHFHFTPRLDLSDSLKAVLEEDFYGVKSGEDVLQLPTSPCVVQLLQAYLNDFPFTDIQVPAPALDGANVGDDVSDLAEEYAEADRSSILCAETCSGLRILFDFLVRDHLLYKEEYSNHDSFMQNPSSDSKSNSSRSSKLAVDSAFSSRHVTSKKLKESPPVPPSSPSGAPSPASPGNRRPLLDLLPLEERRKQPHLPCLVYGPRHFLRLFVKIPEIVSKMMLTLCRRAIVLRHLVLFLRYLETHRDLWFPSNRSTAPSSISSVVHLNPPPKPRVASKKNESSKKSSKPPPKRNSATVSPVESSADSTPALSVSSDTSTIKGNAKNVSKAKAQPSKKSSSGKKVLPPPPISVPSKKRKHVTEVKSQRAKLRKLESTPIILTKLRAR